MAFIRDKSEERTGFQDSAPFCAAYSCQSDFVMVYGLNNTTVERIKQYRDNGYVIHLMVGIAWGSYTDYLNGEYDGRNHWDEAQTDRFGNKILHGKDTPYMVPTVSFADYLTQKLKTAVDAGIEAIHVEEPEFWERAGYSEAFKREYMLYYRAPWRPAYESADASIKAARLKAYLYARTIDRVSSAIKEYAYTATGKQLRFYVPTHSLLNYTQWKIVSPEGKLADIAAVDGCIAQVWTGTSREKNWFNGIFKERTFETAYLEYGVMQELVKGTGKKMWLLHDPIEDNPAFDWDDYRTNYLKTVTASLLHPKVDSYEISPWPNRVFCGKYPNNSPDAQSIPDEYATILNNVFQTLGDMSICDTASGMRAGILMSDSQLYERSYPDSLLSDKAEEKTGTVLVDGAAKTKEFKQKLFSTNTAQGALFGEFVCSNAFPQFYGLALPLLKYGLPVRPVLVDNARRYNGYLDDYDMLVMSYEYMKPDYPDINSVIANWVKRGGLLCYVGDGGSPYHKIQSWWSASYPTAAEHLFEALGITPQGDEGIYKVGKGAVAIRKIAPACLCYCEENAENYRTLVRKLAASGGFKWQYTNAVSLKRGKYTIAAVFDESVSDKPYIINGLFADMYTPDFAIVKDIALSPGQNTLLCDLQHFAGAPEPHIIGTSTRILSMVYDGNKISLKINCMQGVKMYIRLYTPQKITSASINGEKLPVCFDEKSSTVLVSFNGVYGERSLELI